MFTAQEILSLRKFFALNPAVRSVTIHGVIVVRGHVNSSPRMSDVLAQMNGGAA